MGRSLTIVGGKEARPEAGLRPTSALNDEPAPQIGAGEGAMIRMGNSETAIRKRQPTIVDVATTANVAIGTVSRYLNGHKIRRANREQIEEAIEQLGYRRNAVAAAMKTEQTHMVGMLAPKFDEFHGTMLEHLSTAVRRNGRALVTYCHGADPKVMLEAVEFFANQRIDALVATGDEEMYDLLDELIGNGTPVIFYNNDLAGLRADRVFVDNRKAARRAVSHLIDLGHECIAIIGGTQTDSSGLERQQGYLEAMAGHGLTVDPRYLTDGGWSIDGGHNALTHLMALDKPPTAVLAASYPMAVGALGWLKEHSLKVPDALSLVSFDDVPLFRLHEDGITAIAQPVEKIAEAITSLLVSRIANPEEPPRTITLDCDIILRGSTRRRA